MRYTILFFVVVILSSVLLSGCSVQNPYFRKYERGDCNSHRFDDIDSNLNLTFEWKKDTLYVRWNQYEDDGFKGYYLVRTTEEEDSCPYYYVKGPYHHLETKRSKLLFVDEVEEDTRYYYRMCVRSDEGEVDCGSVWRIDVLESSGSLEE